MEGDPGRPANRQRQTRRSVRCRPGKCAPLLYLVVGHQHPEGHTERWEETGLGDSHDPVGPDATYAGHGNTCRKATAGEGEGIGARNATQPTTSWSRRGRPGEDDCEGCARQDALSVCGRATQLGVVRSIWVIRGWARLGF